MGGIYGLEIYFRCLILQKEIVFQSKTEPEL